MGILDDAIKEHLELKRRHGAGEDELKKLEDEAFGAAERPGDEAAAPDPFSEAPTEFMTQPDAPAVEGEAPSEAEAPPKAEEAPDAGASPQAEEIPLPPDESARPQPRAEIADLQEPPAPPESAPEAESAPESAPEGEPEAASQPQPAPEPAADTSPPTPQGPTTAEREAIAEQPTEMFDVEEQLGGLDQGGEVEVVQPPDEDDEDEIDDDFWNEQRLSDELDQALEAPLDDEEEEVFDSAPDTEQAQAPDPAADPAPEPEPRPYVRHDDEDVLEETPDFLEEDSEEDQLWFEQKPPKDFDFDD